MNTGEFESTRRVLAEISSTTWEILTFVVIIMCAFCIVALAVMFISDEGKSIKDKDRKIAELTRKVESLKRSREDGYKKNLETSNVADKIFGMYLDQKDTAESNAIRFAEWDAKQVRRITALEKQLRDNGIEPIKWEDIKNAA